MRRTPEPLYTFTIPSVHDDTQLDCRLYHPDSLTDSECNSSGLKEQWLSRGIAMAHPYAPLGGSYDDRVVGIVLEEFLKAGWVVGTFNFRGAADSRGKTSWSGRPELHDYTSFAAFFVHYMSYLRADPAPNEFPMPGGPSDAPRALQSHRARDHAPQSPIVVMGGYSYGSLILRHLPPVTTILQPFRLPIAGSAHDEIVVRAKKLADQSNLAWINLIEHHERSRKSSDRSPITMGGDETSPDKRRTSRDIRRSHDRGLSAEFGNRLRSLSHRRRKDESPNPPPLETQDHGAITVPEVRYMLISPLTPPTSTLAAPSLGSKFWQRRKGNEQDAISEQATLVVYGDQDMFSSAKKIRQWCGQMSCAPQARFQSIEVAGAGHFWVENGVEAKLRAALRDWTVSLIQLT